MAGTGLVAFVVVGFLTAVVCPLQLGHDPIVVPPDENTCVIPVPLHAQHAGMVVVVVVERESLEIVVGEFSERVIVWGREVQTGHVILLMPLHVAQMVVGIYSPDFIV